MRNSICFLLIFLSNFVNAQRQIAEIVQCGNISGFTEGLKYNDNTLVFCETSAVGFYKNKLILASDKAIPGKSPVFELDYPFTKTTKPNYLLDSILIKATKYEDMAISPNNDLLLLTTGFDRIKEDNSFDAYNCLLYWNPNNTKQIKLANPIKNGNVYSSKKIWEGISKALADTVFPNGYPYFKVEGIAILPKNKIIFGIREKGKTYMEFSYTFQLIQVSYTFENDELRIGTDFSLVYSYIPETSKAQLNFPIGISSLEYSVKHKTLLILTSFENGTEACKRGAYLWSLSLKDITSKKNPKLWITKKNEPLIFHHKAEGITLLNPSTAFIICDDDRTTSGFQPENNKLQTRKPNEATYYIIRLLSF